MSPELICFFLCALSAPNLSGGDALLPAPQSISILSTNMKHFLTWSPVIVQGATVRYSVEFQGEYEREYANGSWIAIPECSLTTATLCNLTQDISASVAYKLRVRAELGAASSPWGTMEGFFNRASTSLTPPKLKVLADGHHLLVELADMGPSFQFHVLYWRKGQESRVQQKVLEEVSSVAHLDTMEAGAEYCVKAQAHVQAINRSSSFSPTQCVRAQGDKSMWLVTALISSAGFAVAALTLPFFTWKISKIFQYSFCPTAVLPDTLVQQKVLEEVSSVAHLDTMEAGAEYCVKAQAHVQAINRSSSFSPTQCVRAQGDKSMWLVTALISSAGFAVAALTLPFFTWKISKIFQYSFCPTAVLPDTLKESEPPTQMILQGSAEAEQCDLMVVVVPSEEVLPLWIQKAL